MPLSFMLGGGPFSNIKSFGIFSEGKENVLESPLPLGRIILSHITPTGSERTTEARLPTTLISIAFFLECSRKRKTPSSFANTTWKFWFARAHFFLAAPTCYCMPFSSCWRDDPLLSRGSQQRKDNHVFAPPFFFLLFLSSSWFDRGASIHHHCRALAQFAFVLLSRTNKERSNNGEEKKKSQPAIRSLSVFLVSILPFFLLVSPLFLFDDQVSHHNTQFFFLALSDRGDLMIVLHSFHSCF